MSEPLSRRRFHRRGAVDADDSAAEKAASIEKAPGPRIMSATGRRMGQQYRRHLRRGARACPMKPAASSKAAARVAVPLTSANAYRGSKAAITSRRPSAEPAQQEKGATHRQV